MLFRKEVLEGRKNQNYGSVSINVPLKYTIITGGFFLFAVLILLFLMVGEFSEKFVVRGYLNSTKGLIRVYPGQNGVITKRFIHQGSHVKKGEPLFLINTSYQGLNRHASQEMLTPFLKRKRWLEAEILYQSKHLRELKPLLIKQYISKAAYREKHDALMLLKNSKSMLESDIIRYKQARSYVIRAPIDGTVSGVMYYEGQHTNATKPLVKLLPEQDKLAVELFVPVRQSEFLSDKNSVLIRYDAYPYQHFGTYRARIRLISQSVLTDDEEENPLKIGEPYYKVIAKLEKPFVMVYGKPKMIKQGMTVTAVIVGEKRKIWQWILDPIYSFYGEIFV